jgi:hypothetical protein
MITGQEPEVCPPTASRDALSLALKGIETAEQPLSR